MRELYEIHITVHQDDALKLMDFVRNESLKFILVHNPEGDHRVQPMISKFKNGTYEEIYDRTMLLKSDMKAFGLRVVRSKIEALLSSSLVPKTAEDLKDVNNYVEFHIKAKTVRSTFEVHQLGKALSTEKVRVGASVNLAGVKKEILVTIRCFNCWYDLAIEHKNKILDEMKQHGLVFDGPLQQEYSVFDDNIALDRNWL